jgi:hypothetical protein
MAPVSQWRAWGLMRHGDTEEHGAYGGMRNGGTGDAMGGMRNGGTGDTLGT